jgi:serine/threonine-protein kinase RsbW
MKYKKEFIYKTDYDLVNVILPFLKKLLISWKVPRNKIDSAIISSSELINNAVYHGNKGDTNKDVEVDVSYENEILSISVSDQGQGFNVTSFEIKCPDTRKEKLYCGGRGLFIVSSYAREIQFLKTPSGGAKVKITI